MSKRKPPIPEEVREWFREQGRRGGKAGGAKGGKRSLVTMTKAERNARARGKRSRLAVIAEEDTP